MIIVTSRLRLDPLTDAAAALVYPLMSDPEVMAHWDVPEFDDPDLVAGVVAQQVADTQSGAAKYWTMQTLADGEFVGVCDLSAIDRAHHTADVGFMLKREAWGQGYALEAMQAVIAHAAGDDFKTLTARTHFGNRRSEALLTNLGFKEAGRVRGEADRDGERRDGRLWALVL
ncbi:MAG: N-acetyltransferase [Caulobacteraceae bacterium]|nr:N-acetyltransferase [Caulobacteraceae bacterium]